MSNFSNNNNNKENINLQKMHSGDATLLDFLKTKKPKSRFISTRTKSAGSADEADESKQSQDPIEMFAKKVVLKIASYNVELDERRTAVTEVNKLHVQVPYMIEHQGTPLVMVEVENKRIVVQSGREAQVVRAQQMPRLEPTKFETVNQVDSTNNTPATNTTTAAVTPPPPGPVLPIPGGLGPPPPPSSDRESTMSAQLSSSRFSSKSSFDNPATPKSSNSALVGDQKPTSLTSFKSGGFKLSSPTSVSSVTSINNKQQQQKQLQQQPQSDPKSIGPGPKSTSKDDAAPNADLTQKLQDYLQQKNHKFDFYQTPKYKSTDDTSSLNQKLLDTIVVHSQKQQQQQQQQKLESTISTQVDTQPPGHKVSSTTPEPSPSTTSVDNSQFIRLANVPLEMDQLVRYNPNAIGVLLIYDPNQNSLQLPRVYVQNNYLGIMLNTYNLQHIFGSSSPDQRHHSGPSDHQSTIIDLVQQPASPAAQLCIKLILFDEQFHPPRQFPFATVCNDRRIQLPPPSPSPLINDSSNQTSPQPQPQPPPPPHQQPPPSTAPFSASSAQSNKSNVSFYNFLNQHPLQMNRFGPMPLPSPSLDDDSELMIQIQSKFPVLGTFGGVAGVPPPPFPPNSFEVIEVFGFFND